jgi:hypothetical protein
MYYVIPLNSDKIEKWEVDDITLDNFSALVKIFSYDGKEEYEYLEEYIMAMGKFYNLLTNSKGKELHKFLSRADKLNVIFSIMKEIPSLETLYYDDIIKVNNPYIFTSEQLFWEGVRVSKMRISKALVVTKEDFEELIIEFGMRDYLESFQQDDETSIVTQYRYQMSLN